MNANGSRYEKESQRHFIVALIVWLLLLFAFVFLLSWHPPDEEGVFSQIRQILLEISGTAVLFGILYNFLTTVNYRRENLQALTLLFNEQPEFLSRLSAETQRDIVKNTLKAVLGSSYGNIVYEQIVRSYLEPKEPFRTDYSYYLTCNQNRTGGLVLNDHALQFQKTFEKEAQKYIWLRQDIRIVQCRNNPIEHFHETLLVALVFDAETLNKLIPNSDFVFTDVVRFPIDIFEQFSEAESDQALEAIVKEVFDFQVRQIHGGKVSANDTFDDRSIIKVRWQTTEVKNVPKKYIEIHIANQASENQTREEAGFDRAFVEFAYHICFTLPQSRSNSNFSVSLSYPTQRPLIDFSVSGTPIKNLEAVEHISQFGVRESCNIMDINSDIGTRHIRFQSQKWIFPNSGIMFVWEDNS